MLILVLFLCSFRFFSTGQKENIVSKKNVQEIFKKLDRLKKEKLGYLKIGKKKVFLDTKTIIDDLKIEIVYQISTDGKLFKERFSQTFSQIINKFLAKEVAANWLNRLNKQVSELSFFENLMQITKQEALLAFDQTAKEASVADLKAWLDDSDEKIDIIRVTFFHFEDKEQAQKWLDLGQKPTHGFKKSQTFTTEIDVESSKFAKPQSLFKIKKAKQAIVLLFTEEVKYNVCLKDVIPLEKNERSLFIDENRGKIFDSFLKFKNGNFTQELKNFQELKIFKEKFIDLEFSTDFAEKMFRIANSITDIKKRLEFFAITFSVFVNFNFVVASRKKFLAQSLSAEEVKNHLLRKNRIETILKIFDQKFSEEKQDEIKKQIADFLDKVVINKFFLLEMADTQNIVAKIKEKPAVKLLGYLKRIPLANQIRTLTNKGKVVKITQKKLLLQDALTILLRIYLKDANLFKEIINNIQNLKTGLNMEIPRGEFSIVLSAPETDFSLEDILDAKELFSSDEENLPLVLDFLKSKEAAAEIFIEQQTLKKILQISEK